MKPVPRETKVKANENHHMSGQTGRVTNVFEAVFNADGCAYIVEFEDGRKCFMSTDEFEVIK